MAGEVAGDGGERRRRRRINVLTGNIDGSLALTGPYSMDGHWRDPRPRLAVAGDDVFVTDPTAGLIHVVDIGSFAKDRAIKVDGMPYDIIAVAATASITDGGARRSASQFPPAHPGARTGAASRSEE